jgi:O-antigen/teichoic acid export membrane protein
MIRSALLILSGNAAASLLLLVRNLIIARLIPVADYGVAATFAIAMAVVEMMSQLGLQQQIVQAKNGEDPRFQAALQGFQLLRGVIAGAALWALAQPLADFLNVPQAAWAYQVMALVPVLNGLTHFDVHRLNRSMVFLPVILTGAVPALLSALAVWPLAIFYGDYQVMLYAIVVQAVMTAVTSHLVAQRPYRLVLDRAVMASSLRFGWPLLVNGILMFAVFNGDKMIVGRELGMEVLAIFAMGFTLTLTPTLVMAKSAQNFFLPQLSVIERSTPKGEAQFQSLSLATMQAILVMGLSLVMLVTFFGGPLVTGLLGEKYAALVAYMIWLAIMQAVRVVKAGPAIVALALGHTSNAMIANGVRVLSLPFCWYIAITSGDLLMIFIAIVGEILGYGASLLLLRQRSSVYLRGMRVPLCGAFVFCVASLFLFSEMTSEQELSGGGILKIVLYTGLAVWVFRSCHALRLYVKRRHTYRVKA